MNRFLLIVLTCLLLVSSVFSADQVVRVDRVDGVPSFLGYVPDRFVVVLKEDVGRMNMTMAANDVVQIGEPAFDALSQKYAASKFEKQFKGSNPVEQIGRYYKVSFNDGTLEDAMAEYAALPMVEKVEPIGIHSMYATPNDTYYDPYQWYHNQTNDDDIDSPEAWDIQTGNSSITLAILDSGTRYYHPDLGGVNATTSNVGASRGNMWINNAELNGSAGVDDDGNGYVDDWIGYDFIEVTSGCWPGEDCGTQDNDPRDFNGHGTHCAGIVGMMTNDGYGMSGVGGGWGNGSQSEYGNGVKVMACRIGFSYSYRNQEVGVVYMDAAAEAFYYAADNGARVASCSWGSSNSGGIDAAADYFVNNGGLIFTAAGNDGSETPSYLASRSDVISVAATDQNDAAASFTTYGTWVDISAPGVGIYSTFHDNTDPLTTYWASMDGTSMACPMAAAVSAMIWSQNPTWTNTQVEAQLYASAENIDAELTSTYIGKMGAGRINLHDAVNTGAPAAPVANFIGTPTSGTEPLTVNFSDLSTGTVDTWSWAFGDGGTSTTQNPSHVYTTAGTYNVSLTVTGPGGTDGETKNGYITVDPCVAPTAGFVGSPVSGDFNLNVTFTDQSSGAATYAWTFGDGGTSTVANPSYTYTAAGTYTVTQTVTNSCGSDQMTRIDYITVTTPVCDPPVAAFSGSPTSGDYPLNVSFTDATTNSPTSWSWTFGDGGTSTAQNPSYTYTAAGTYSVSLTATNACGSDAVTMTDYITVTTPTVSNMHISDITVDRIAIRNRSQASATVTIVDGSSNPVSGATVTVYFTGPKASTYSGITGAGGQVTILSKAGNGTAEWCAEVTNVSASGWTYDSGANVVTKACESGFVFAYGDSELLSLPSEFGLHQNYPNPFNPSTNISFTLAAGSQVSLEVYNLLGQKIATLANGHLGAGSHTFEWEASTYSSGIYLYRLTTVDGVETKKMFLMK